MNQFFQRVANYIANEVLIKGLAESRTFQRFALRTHTSIEEMKGKGAEKLNTTLDEVHKAATEAAYKSESTTARGAGSSGGGSKHRSIPQPPLRGFAGFISAFGKEIRKDLGMGK